MVSHIAQSAQHHSHSLPQFKRECTETVMHVNTAAVWLHVQIVVNHAQESTCKTRVYFPMGGSAGSLDRTDPSVYSPVACATLQLSQNQGDV